MNEESPIAQYYDHDSCVTEAVSAAESKLAESNHTLAKL